jgi:FtsP/CotA-like multicopper oxidase with cupredoxin domain
VPATPHLHGGEVPPELDGGPSSWFTSDGATAGAAYYPGVSGTTKAANRVTYRYPNSQEASPAWFHDHTLGTTRLNVYAGLAGAYIITDTQALPPDFPPVSSTIPLVIQDRMFDTDGQLFFPAATAGGKVYSPNPEHPYWIPEFLGDVIVVNGKAWPYLDVEPKRYRFLILNGSNSRTYDLSLPAGARIFVIGNDGGHLDAAKPVDNLVVMPGERYDTVIDFSGVAPAVPWKSVVLANAAHAPYPQGAPPAGSLGQVVQFRVTSTCAPTGCGLASTTWNPAVAPAIRTVKGGTPMVRLVTADGAPATTPAVKRMLTLNEVKGPPQKALDPATGASTDYPGGPSEILVNNTPWSAASPRPYGDFISLGTLQVSELPREGDTELWEIVNLTPDAHPVHLHLVQFQLLNRQRFDVDDYGAVYAGAFPGARGCPGVGSYCPGFGPPNDYRRPNASGYVGGNPDIRRALKGAAIAPAAQETGWKDTVMAPPGMVTRFVVRWSPPSAPLGATGAAAAFPFDPSGRAVDADLKPIPGSAKHGYVWHCHMIDHEDNDMMRPSFVTALDVGPRELRKGRDY